MQVNELHDGACLRVPLSHLVDAPWGNVRRGKRSEAKFAELRDSVKQRGVVQAITVRPNDADNTLEVLAGYGRRDASTAVGADDIPVVIKRVDDKEAMAIGLAENLQREDLSIIDEIGISQQYVSLFEADYEEAAKAIGWNERKLRGRLKLNDCSESVLTALGDGTIKIGHAEVLCQFVEKLQNNTLSLVIEEGWSVDYLKERANKATRFLRHAKFNIDACQSCPHNSSVQAELFDSHIGEAKCGNLPCYREKSDAWVTDKKAVLEREEGRVFLSVEKPSTDRNTVSVAVVGEAAYTEECLPCVNRVRVLQDGINKCCGTVTNDQCIDLGCFKKKVAALAEANTPTQSASKEKSAKASKAGGTVKTTAATISKGMKEQAEAFARKVLGEELLKTDSYRLALQLVGVSDLTGYSPKGRTLADRSDALSRLAALSPDELNSEIDKALSHGVLTASSAMGRFDATSAVLKSAKRLPEAKLHIVAAWKPSKAWFETYQKGAIEGFCRQRNIGFAKAFDDQEGKGAFAKLIKRKKDEIIQTILGFEFDWAAVAPKEVTDLVK